MMDKFKELFSLCKASVTLTVNNHKDFYETIESYINDIGNGDQRQNIDNEVFDEMVKRDTLIELQVYPDSPVAFFVVYHYDIDKAIDIALNELKK